MGPTETSVLGHRLGALKDHGVVVFDNSDWTHLFQDGMSLLERAGFKRLDFFGFGPINTYSWMTTVFYRPGNNVLDI